MTPKLSSQPAKLVKQLKNEGVSKTFQKANKKTGLAGTSFLFLLRPKDFVCRLKELYFQFKQTNQIFRSKYFIGYIFVAYTPKLP